MDGRPAEDIRGRLADKRGASEISGRWDEAPHHLGGPFREVDRSGVFQKGAQNLKTDGKALARATGGGGGGGQADEAREADPEEEVEVGPRT